MIRCGVTSMYDNPDIDPDFPPSVCTREAGHLGFHSNGSCEWWHPVNDSRRRAPDVAIADAKELYVHSRISFKEFELAVEAALG